MLAIGKKAPLFTLSNQDGARIKLADLRGRTVLLFAYPKAATSGCAVQARGFRDHLAAIAERDCTVLGLSPDPVDRLRKWHAQENFGFDLLSDPEHEVLAKYGAWGPKKLYGKTYEGVIRSHFLIDPAGNLADVQVKVSPDQSIARALASLGLG